MAPSVVRSVVTNASAGGSYDYNIRRRNDHIFGLAMILCWWVVAMDWYRLRQLRLIWRVVVVMIASVGGGLNRVTLYDS